MESGAATISFLAVGCESKQKNLKSARVMEGDFHKVEKTLTKDRLTLGEPSLDNSCSGVIAGFAF